ncbi:MAG: zinc ribbon domain-containing protein [Bryobacterales bacterium]|nr:zinc ribbon domain-containing protein [Bryobacterales bacterium]
MWPLKGKLECGGCGRPLSPHGTRRGNKVYRYYRCRATAGGRSPCGYQISAGLLKNAVGAQLPNRTRDDFVSQRIRQLVDHVVYDPRSGRIRVQLRPPEPQSKWRLFRVEDRDQLLPSLAERGGRHLA